MSDPGRAAGVTAGDGATRPVRIGTAERDKTVEQLREHLAAGRLDLEEYEDRVGAAYAARTDQDLDPLLVDLPAPADRRRAVDDGRHAGLGRHTARRAALGPYLGVNAMMVVIWATSGGGYFWPVWVIGPWGLALLPMFGRGRRRSGRAAR